MWLEGKKGVGVFVLIDTRGSQLSVSNLECWKCFLREEFETSRRSWKKLPPTVDQATSEDVVRAYRQATAEEDLGCDSSFVDFGRMCRG